MEKEILTFNDLYGILDNLVISSNLYSENLTTKLERILKKLNISCVDSVAFNYCADIYKFKVTININKLMPLFNLTIHQACFDFRKYENESFELNSISVLVSGGYEYFFEEAKEDRIMSNILVPKIDLTKNYGIAQLQLNDFTFDKSDLFYGWFGDKPNELIYYITYKYSPNSNVDYIFFEDCFLKNIITNENIRNIFLNYLIFNCEKDETFNKIFKPLDQLSKGYNFMQFNRYKQYMLTTKEIKNYINILWCKINKIG